MDTTTTTPNPPHPHPHTSTTTTPKKKNPKEPLYHGIDKFGQSVHVLLSAPPETTFLEKVSDITSAVVGTTTNHHPNHHLSSISPDRGGGFVRTPTSSNVTRNGLGGGGGGGEGSGVSGGGSGSGSGGDLSAVGESEGDSYDDDPVGTQIAKILNSESLPEFSYERYRKAVRRRRLEGNDRDNDDGGLFPLLSLRNLHRIYRLVHRLFQFLLSFSSPPTPSTPPTLPHQNPLQSLLRLLLLATLLLSLTTHTLLTTTIHILLLIAGTICWLLIDIQDLRRILFFLPTFILRRCGVVGRAVRWMDGVFLFGREFRGREEGVKPSLYRHRVDRRGRRRGIPAALVGGGRGIPLRVGGTDGGGGEDEDDGTNRDSTASANTVTSDDDEGDVVITSTITPSFQCRDVDWNKIYTSIAYRRSEDGTSYHGENTTRHLLGVIFAYVMTRGSDHKSLLHDKHHPKRTVTPNSKIKKKGSHQPKKRRPGINGGIEDHSWLPSDRSSHTTTITTNANQQPPPSPHNGTSSTPNTPLTPNPPKPIHTPPSSPTHKTHPRRRSISLQGVHIRSFDGVETILPSSSQPDLADGGYDDEEQEYELSYRQLPSDSPMSMRKGGLYGRGGGGGMRRVNSDSDLGSSYDFYSQYSDGGGGGGVDGEGGGGGLDNFFGLASRWNAAMNNDDDGGEDDDGEAEGGGEEGGKGETGAYSTSSSPLKDARSKLMNGMSKRDMKWLDVGAKIGIKLLNSERVQKVIAGKTTTTDDGLTTEGGTMMDNHHPSDYFGSENAVLRPSSASGVYPESIENTSSPTEGGTNTTTTATTTTSMSLQHHPVPKKFHFNPSSEPAHTNSTMMAHTPSLQSTPLTVAKPFHAIWTAPTPTTADEKGMCYGPLTSTEEEEAEARRRSVLSTVERGKEEDENGNNVHDDSDLSYATNIWVSGERRRKNGRVVRAPKPIPSLGDALGADHHIMDVLDDDGCSGSESEEEEIQNDDDGSLTTEIDSNTFSDGTSIYSYTNHHQIPQQHQQQQQQHEEQQPISLSSQPLSTTRAKRRDLRVSIANKRDNIERQLRALSMSSSSSFDAVTTLTTPATTAATQSSSDSHDHHIHPTSTLDAVTESYDSAVSSNTIELMETMTSTTTSNGVVKEPLSPPPFDANRYLPQSMAIQRHQQQQEEQQQGEIGDQSTSRSSSSSSCHEERGRSRTRRRVISMDEKDTDNGGGEEVEVKMEEDDDNDEDNGPFLDTDVTNHTSLQSDQIIDDHTSPNQIIRQQQRIRHPSPLITPTSINNNNNNNNNIDQQRQNLHRRPTNCSIPTPLPTPATNDLKISNLTSTQTTRSKKKYFQRTTRRPILLPGVKIFVPMFPYTDISTRSKKEINSVTGCYHQIGTVIRSERVHDGSHKLFQSSDFGREQGGIGVGEGRGGGGEAVVDGSNSLSITVALDQSFLRDGGFAEMILRISDYQRQMPRHSKFPIGSCVSTSFGIGVLVGWRVEDDIHIVRSLWQKRGRGSGRAYLHRTSLHSTIPASVGFKVETTHGNGKIIGFVDGVGVDYRRGRYLVLVKRPGRADDVLRKVGMGEILDCKAARFVPVVEQIKEAANYRIRVDNYEVAMLQRRIEDAAKDGVVMDKTWRFFSEGFELFLSSFIKAAEEDTNFDSEISNFLTVIIEFLEDFDMGGKKRKKKRIDGGEDGVDGATTADDPLPSTTTIPGKPKLHIDTGTSSSSPEEGCSNTKIESKKNWQVGWISNDLIRDMIRPYGYNKKNELASPTDKTTSLSPTDEASMIKREEAFSESYKKIYAFLRTITRTITIAISASSDTPNLKMALSMIHETLLFIRTVIKVQQKNLSQTSLAEWKTTLARVSSILGPANARFQKVGRGIAQRLEVHGNIAKLRTLRFTEILFADDRLVDHLEAGDLPESIACLENAAVRADIIQREDCERYRQVFTSLYKTMAPRARSGREAAARNGQKLTLLAKTLKVLATPGRSALTVLTQDDVLEAMERLLVRVFERTDEACVRVVHIYSWNFRSFRHLRILSNIAVSGKLWAPVLDAADEEFTWAVSRAPVATQMYVEPLSKLFSLGVARFHELSSQATTMMSGGSGAGLWLDFLMEEESVKIIQELDAKLVLFLKNFCNDVEAMMDVLPYYSSIDDDILNLIDEVDLDKVLKEAAEAFVDEKKFLEYVREKSTLAISRFLDFLPKISIPIERREIGEGWVITCRGTNGKDLTLSIVTMEKEDLLCNVLGSKNVLSSSPEKYADGSTPHSSSSSSSLTVVDELHISPANNLNTDEMGNVEVSILDHVAELIRNAQNHGCWQAGVGGVVDSPSSAITQGNALSGLPLSHVLLCAIELWENLDIDDDELVEIAIRDISYQIELQNARQNGSESSGSNYNHQHNSSNNNWPEEATQIVARHRSRTAIPEPPSYAFDICNTFSIDSSNLTDPGSTQAVFASSARKFDPKKDPTILFVNIKRLTCSLDDFTFRVEPATRRTIFDPVFEGGGSLTIRNASIKLRIECRKERIMKLGEEVTVPVLQLQEHDVGLEEVMFKFKETGMDWVLNKIVSNFSDKITQLVIDNLRQQIALSINAALDNLNKYIEVNPEIMLKILGITIDDLEENIAWV